MTPKELEAAMLKPASMFGSPEKVLENAELSREQKIEVLSRWEYDAAEEAVALEEGMPGQESDLLRRILVALGKLDGIDVERAGPSKQHGITCARPPARLMSSPEPASAIPDLGPDAYARWRASELGSITERLERQLILELVGDVEGCRVLDVGCGDGKLAVELTKRGAIVVGIDASPEMIDAAKGRPKPRNADISFQVARAEQLPFPAGQFDVVTAITILCFVEDAAPVFQEIARVLRPGGRLVIGELGKWSTWAAGRRIRAWLGSRLWRRGRFKTADELRHLAERAGLVVEAVRGAVYYPRWGMAARVLSPLDPTLGRLTTAGAGFVALSTIKQAERP
jgi:ubiquinone biosynthesis O-methyltransferase